MLKSNTNIKYFLTFIFFIASVCIAPAQQISTRDEFFVDSVMNANFKPGGPGAVILIAKTAKRF